MVRQAACAGLGRPVPLPTAPMATFPSGRETRLFPPRLPGRGNIGVSPRPSQFPAGGDQDQGDRLAASGLGCSLMRRIPATLRPSSVGCIRSVKRPQRQHPRTEACLVEGFKSAMPKRQRLLKSPARLASEARHRQGTPPSLWVHGLGSILCGAVVRR